jgi:hypothetical protein
MQEVFKLLISTGVLALGIPIGMFLAKKTKEELKQGKNWFKLIVLLGLVGGFVAFIIRQDALMFSLFFIAIVTAMSLRK